MDDLKVRGRIFNIQRFSVHDGKGIRTIVFFKGCPLRCKWCCNPESQNFAPEKMTENGKIKDVGRDVTVAEVLAEVEKDRDYYRRSGGGMTLSGGECFAQPQFCEALLRAAKERGISTAVETTSFPDYSIIEKCLPYIDIYMTDIKQLDDAKHRAFTGQSNKTILSNIAKVVRSGANVIIRTPVIPTVNATKEDILAIATFARTIGAKEMHLLPYHRIGMDKDAGLGRDYQLKDLLPPEKDLMQTLLETVESVGLKSQIGG